MIGTKIGQYEIIEELGAGGMSTIYRAKQTPMNRLITLKVLSPMLVQDAKFPGRFEREIRVISRLDHPHIETIHDFGEADGRMYIASQYLGGGSMAQRLQQAGKLDLTDILEPIRQIAEALDYAHSQNVVHRNVKPDNILFDEAGNAYLSDFEIAYVSDDVITSEAIVGSPAYSAPEQLFSQKIDHRTDIYAFGVTVFELVTGGLPFRADNPMSLAMMQMQEPVPSATKRNPQLPASIDEIFKKVMAKDPDDRYTTASKFVNALAQLKVPSRDKGRVKGILRQWKNEPAQSSISHEAPPIPTRRIFISYRKLDKDVVHPMANRLKEKYGTDAVWIDMNLEGGQHWWNTILEEIRNADIIITALSDDYLDSIPCQREYRYALDLNKTMLPVRVGQLDFNRVAKDLIQIQMVDFVDNTEVSQEKLYSAIIKAPVSPPLPDHLPIPPPIPLSILVEVEELANKTSITTDDEHKIFSHLFDIINSSNPTERDSALNILEKLQARRDISRGFYDKLQTLNAKPKGGGLFGFLRGRRKR